MVRALPHIEQAVVAAGARGHGLRQFAMQVVPGSLRVIAAQGDERNALIMYEVDTAGGPVGAKTFPSAQTWLLNEQGKIQTERIISYVISRAE